MMVNMQLPNTARVHSFDIRDMTNTLPEPERKNLGEVLAAGQSGIAQCDDKHDGWSVW